jgi:hypothetical protein
MKVIYCREWTSFKILNILFWIIYKSLKVLDFIRASIDLGLKRLELLIIWWRANMNYFFLKLLDKGYQIRKILGSCLNVCLFKRFFSCFYFFLRFLIIIGHLGSNPPPLESSQCVIVGRSEICERAERCCCHLHYWFVDFINKHLWLFYNIEISKVIEFFIWFLEFNKFRDSL